jgi:predicted acylesterase/phospholipase RssA
MEAAFRCGGGAFSTRFRVRRLTMDGPRIALILGGGAARGFAHVGVLEVLEREGVRPAFVGGASMGGLIAALWAAGLDCECTHC